MPRSLPLFGITARYTVPAMTVLDVLKDLFGVHASYYILVVLMLVLSRDLD